MPCCMSSSHSWPTDWKTETEAETAISLSQKQKQLAVIHNVGYRTKYVIVTIDVGHCCGSRETTVTPASLVSIDVT